MFHSLVGGSISGLPGQINSPFSHSPSSHPSFAAACASLQAIGHSALLPPTTGGPVLPPHPQGAAVPPAIHSAFPSHLSDYASLLYRPLAAAGAIPGYLPMSSNLLAARLSSKSFKFSISSMKIKAKYMIYVTRQNKS